MHIAVVILNFNGRTLLDDCLSNLRRLTTPAEIIVADNGSTDDSLAHLRAHHPHVRVIALEKNWGFAEGYNRALAQVDADWLALLNNDALPEPDWLEQLLAAAERHPRAAIVGGKLLFGGVPAERGRILQCAGAGFTSAGTAFEVGWGQPERGQYDEPAATASIPGAALLIKREVFVKLGGFDGDYFAYLEDVDLCWRAWLAGHEVWYEPSAVAFHHFGGFWGGRASPRRIELMQRNRLANMIKLLEPLTLLNGLAVSIAYDAYRVLEYSLRRDWSALRALMAGTVAFGRALPQLLRARTAIQRARQVSDAKLRARGLLVSALTGFREYRRLGQLGVSAQAGAPQR